MDNAEDLKIDTFISSMRSGWIPTVKVTVRVTHMPTGIYAESSDRRGVYANTDAALAKLEALLSSEA